MPIDVVVTFIYDDETTRTLTTTPKASEIMNPYIEFVIDNAGYRYFTIRSSIATNGFLLQDTLIPSGKSLANLKSIQMTYGEFSRTFTNFFNTSYRVHNDIARGVMEEAISVPFTEA